MINEICKDGDFRWIDLSDPTEEELDSLQEEFQLPNTLVMDCLDPIHLPKSERFGNSHFVILRLFDPSSDLGADSIGSLTRKVAIFINEKIIITVHRFDKVYFQEIASQCILAAADANVSGEKTAKDLFYQIGLRALRSYQHPLAQAEIDLDKFESALFDEETDDPLFKSVHVVRRRLSLIKRILIHTQDAFHQQSLSDKIQSSDWQNLKDTLSTLLFLSDELAEDTTNLLNMQLTIASQRTNEVVKVLTVFSVFFMPLTFIVGVYGMNFKHMPEIDWPYGYYMVIAIMVLISLIIGLWFFRKGWLFNKRIV